jgi:hypothetical protein
VCGRARASLVPPGCSADRLKIAEQLSDLNNYDSKLSDGGVIAWPTSYTSADRKNDKREVEFTIQAQVLKAADSSKEEL